MPSLGRFLTRDTWGGNANNPLSFNKWLYVEGNPINLVDPSGMRPKQPQSKLSKYCYPLLGKDYSDCLKILAGIDPESPVSGIELFLYNISGYCPDDPLYVDLPHSLGLKTSKAYGWWWHYLLDQSSGGWKRSGESHVYIKDVIARALLPELSIYSNTNYTIDGKKYNVGALVAEAFARKSHETEIGFYGMLGGRQSVMKRVDNAIYGYGYGIRDYLIYDDNDLSDGLKRFENDLQNDERSYGQNRVVSAYQLAGYVLDRTDWNRPMENRPYEWGNPTGNAPKSLTNALLENNKGWLAKNVLYTSGDFVKTNPLSTFFILTQEQMRNLCGLVSCVTGK